MKKKQLLKIKIGVRAYKRGRDDYSGMYGTIEYCDKCCNLYRVQFDKIGNNEPLQYFNLKKCEIFLV